MKLYSYKNGSASAKALCKALNIKRILHEGPPMDTNHVVINWGASNITRSLNAPRMLNHPQYIKNASNKLQAFKTLSKGVATPQWTESREEASTWLAEGIVVCRTILNGHSGEGIVLVSKIEDMVDAPLYTKYVDKTQEYRIHVNAGEVFFVQRKARKKSVPDEQVNWKIRNHHNGFIYANIDVEVGDDAKEQAIMACNDLGLDFCAVDIIVDKGGKYYVLEVNTAPGLAGTTLDKYVEQFSKYV